MFEILLIRMSNPTENWKNYFDDMKAILFNDFKVRIYHCSYIYIYQQIYLIYIGVEKVPLCIKL